MIEAFERLSKEFEAVGGREVQLRHEAFDAEKGLERIHVRRKSPCRVRVHGVVRLKEKAPAVKDSGDSLRKVKS